VKTTYYKLPKSCLDAKNLGAFNQAGNQSSGIYTIDPDGFGFGMSPFTVYCDQETDDGGWTLVMKQAQNDGVTLQGDTAYWTNSSAGTLNDTVGNQAENNGNLVSKAFTTISGTQMMLKASNETTRKYRSGVYNSAFASFQGTLQSFADGANSTRPDWFIHATTYPNGTAITSARFDFNFMEYYLSTGVCGARWGWAANENGPDSATAGSHDSCGGLGAYGTNYGSVHMNSNKSAWQPAVLLLYIK
jgi:hypothetical protein